MTVTEIKPITIGDLRELLSKYPKDSEVVFQEPSNKFDKVLSEISEKIISKDQTKVIIRIT